MGNTCPWPCPRCEVSALLTNENRKASTWALCFFFFLYAAAAAVIHLHNIVRPTLGLQLFCLDVIPTFQSGKKKVPGISPAFF